MRISSTAVAAVLSWPPGSTPPTQKPDYAQQPRRPLRRRRTTCPCCPDDSGPAWTLWERRWIINWGGPTRRATSFTVTAGSDCTPSAARGILG
ncbi:UNVERIFIED_CONTAM: hypothetical protein Sangu_0079000 [Sesamum angustifolium]|uniref:Secreted protein n=1 Tax=Sesamum angustifolium TaxID=2727405 RepID=A0AAW2RIZ3_9LAMI